MAEKNTFEEILEKNGKLIYTNKGVSMMPLLREDHDVMVIEKKAPGERYRNLDAVLFIRPNVSGRGRYVLHRILRVNPDGTYWIVGDNCLSGETVREEHILGILTQVVRDNKVIKVTDTGYKMYVNLWCRPYRFRFAVMRGKHFARRCGSKAKRMIKGEKQNTGSGR